MSLPVPRARPAADRGHRPRGPAASWCCSPSTCRSCRSSAAAGPTTRPSPRPAASRPATRSRSPGVDVGKVTGVDLENAHVMVTFTVKGSTRLGDDTAAAVKLQTLLGKKYLAITPAGPGQLSSSREIPLSRTTPSYDVVDAFSRPDHDDPADRLRPAGAVARDAGHDVQGQPGRRQGLARRAVPAVRDDRLARRPAARAAVPGQRRQRHGGQPQRRRSPR